MQVAILLVSMSMLMLEVLKTITLSLQLFHQTAFMVVSLSLLGLGAGASLTTWLSRRPGVDLARRIPEACVAFAASIILAEVLTTRLTGLIPLIFASTVPFLFAGVFLASVFTTAPARAHSLYFANLVGSALGCVGLIALLAWRGEAGTVVIVCAALGFTAAATISKERRAMIAVSVVGVALSAGLLPFQDTLFPYRPNPEKHYGMALSDPSVSSKVDWSRWGFLGRLDSVIPGPGFERVPYDISKYFPSCEFRYLFASGDNWSYTIRCPEGSTGFDTAGQAAHSVPYSILPAHPDVLNIGLGGGIDVYIALRQSAKSVVGVEINPLMIEATKSRHRTFFNDPYHDPRVTIKELDGRTFVETTGRDFDLVTLSAVDTGAGLAAGANLLSENYLYTQEAFEGYFKVLRDDGVLYVFRPFPQLLRSIATAVSALRSLGESTPERHVVIFRQGDAEGWTGAIFSRKPLDANRVRTIEEHLGVYPLEYAPDRLDGARPLVADFFGRVAHHDESSFFNSLPYDARPVTDDRPYYYQQEPKLLDSIAGRLLLRILFWVTLGGIVFIVLPIAGKRIGRWQLMVPVLLYFVALGAGYMFVEVGLIQKLALFLGHPAYSITVTLVSMLLFSGLGSMFASRFFPADRPPRALPFAVITLCVAGYAFALHPILSHIRIESLALRSVVVVVLLAPASFFQGMPFPMMLRRVGEGSAALVPWAYAVNSVASVAASVLVVLVAMGAGFRGVLVLGAACYLLAMLVAVRFLRGVGVSTA